MFKRTMDIIFSTLFMIFLSPLFLLVALAIKWTDGGPVLFSQTRIGRDGQPFIFFKFRSMIVDAHQYQKDLLIRNHHDNTVTFKMKQDPRVTRIGAIIRKLSIDELPQLFNVIKGDISLVGPRPQPERD